MIIACRKLITLWSACAVLLSFVCCAQAHTLPVSYLRISPDTDYLHLELVFNPFELAFISEVDENGDGGLDPGELSRHGDKLVQRVTDALTITVGGRKVTAETAGMDPDLNGHHVRMRAHYKVDARKLPVKIESGLNAITSASHLVQVTWSGEGPARLAQLDAQSRDAIFVSASSAAKHAPPGKAGRPWPALLAGLAGLAIVAGLMRFAAVCRAVRKQGEELN